MGSAPVAVTSSAVADAARRRGDVVLLVAIAAGLALLASCRPSGAGGAGRLELGGLALPGLCWFRGLTGRDCAGCGLTRAIVLLLHGRAREALALHPFSPAVLGLALAQAGLRSAHALRPSGTALLRAERLWDRAALLTLVLMLGWWSATLLV